MYQVAKLEIIKIGNRIDTTEITDTDYYGTEAEATEAAEKIIAEKPDGIARVTVVEVDENGDPETDECTMDEMI